MKKVMDKPVTVGLVGCGKISDIHLEVMASSPLARLVGVCDRELLMARQAGRRFHVPSFESAEEMLAAVKPEAVHITTPPQSHMALATLALDSGCHIYVEKPFALNIEEGKTILAKAAECRRLVVAGYNALFSRAMNRAREMIRGNALGGPPFLIESWYAYNIENEDYARALLNNAEHWVRALPGGLVQNVISHALAPVAEWLGLDHLAVNCLTFQSPILQRIHERDICDEVRLAVYDGQSVSGIVIFSSQLKPPYSAGVRYYGDMANILIDQGSQTVILEQGRNYKSYLNYVFAPWAKAREYARAARVNLKELLLNRSSANFGMRYLAEEFYRAIRGTRPSPTPPDLILREMRIMDEIIATMRRAGYTTE